jgi:hypothetical protein
MAKVCPQCQKENPSAANFCMFCNTPLVENAEIDKVDKLHSELSDAKETIQVLKEALKEKKKAPVEKVIIEKVITQPPAPAPVRVPPKVTPVKDTKSFPTGVLLVGLALLLVIGGSIGYLGFYKPYAIDRDAPRYYTFTATNTFLRSTKDVGVDFNILARLPYGSQIIWYEYDGKWARIKWIDNQNKSIKGYISSNYILSETDFKILNDIWGDADSKEIINTAKCRIALLNYLKENNLSGWQVFSKNKESKTNSTYYKRITNPSSKFTDFAVIIKNTVSSERKCLLFRFDDDETPYFVYEEQAPSTGDIYSIDYKSLTNELQITYR